MDHDLLSPIQQEDIWKRVCSGTHTGSQLIDVISLTVFGYSTRKEDASWRSVSGSQRVGHYQDISIGVMHGLSDGCVLFLPNKRILRTEFTGFVVKDTVKGYYELKSFAPEEERVLWYLDEDLDNVAFDAESAELSGSPFVACFRASCRRIHQEHVRYYVDRGSLRSLRSWLDPFFPD